MPMWPESESYLPKGEVPPPFPICVVAERVWAVALVERWWRALGPLPGGKSVTQLQAFGASQCKRESGGATERGN